MSDIGQKLRSLRESEGLSRRAFGERVGIPEAKVQALEIGKQRVDHETLRNIARNFSISSDWLLDETTDATDVPGFSESLPQVFANREQLADFISIPAFCTDALEGTDKGHAEGEAVGQYAFSRRWLLRRDITDETLAVVQVSGESMQPRLSDGDLVVIDRSDTELRDGVTFVFRLGDDLLIKRLQILPQRHVKLSSPNPEFEPLLIDMANGELIPVGRVVASMHAW